MDNYENDFDKIENAAADRRRQQDQDDLASESRGDDVGRTARFLSPEARERLQAQRQGKPSKTMSALELALMSDPAYVAAYEAARDETRNAQGKVQAFQDEVEAAITKTDTDMERLLDSAVTMPDGNKAFMDKDGIAWTLEGDQVDAALAEGIDWAGKPSREDYQRLIEQQSQLEQYAHRGHVMADHLGENQNRLEDDDNPPTHDELDAIQEEAQKLSDDANSLSEELRLTLQPDTNASMEPTTISPGMVPTL